MFCTPSKAHHLLEPYSLAPGHFNLFSALYFKQQTSIEKRLHPFNHAEVYDMLAVGPEKCSWVKPFFQGIQ